MPFSHASPLRLGSKLPSSVPTELTASLVLIPANLVFYCNLEPKKKGIEAKPRRRIKF